MNVAVNLTRSTAALNTTAPQNERLASVRVAVEEPRTLTVATVFTPVTTPGPVKVLLARRRTHARTNLLAARANKSSLIYYLL